MNIVVIPARGGSKGIPKKNLIRLLGKPLLAWSIESAVAAEHIDDVYVSSDDEEILEVATSYGAKVIERPAEISNDLASSESVWLHAIDVLNSKAIYPDTLVALQATSPIRSSSDIDSALALFSSGKFDSLLGATASRDVFFWRKKNDVVEPINYNPLFRKRRQDIEEKFIENGSIYIFKVSAFKETKVRVFGKTGIYEMDKYKSFQIDDSSDIIICESILKNIQAFSDFDK